MKELKTILLEKLHLNKDVSKISEQAEKIINTLGLNIDNLNKQMIECIENWLDDTSNLSGKIYYVIRDFKSKYFNIDYDSTNMKYESGDTFQKKFYDSLEKILDNGSKDNYLIFRTQDNKLFFCNIEKGNNGNGLITPSRSVRIEKIK